MPSSTLARAGREGGMPLSGKEVAILTCELCVPRCKQDENSWVKGSGHLWLNAMLVSPPTRARPPRPSVAVLTHSPHTREDTQMYWAVTVKEDFNACWQQSFKQVIEPRGIITPSKRNSPCIVRCLIIPQRPWNLGKVHHRNDHSELFYPASKWWLKPGDKERQ